MKGTLHKLEDGWEIWYSKPRTDNQNGYYLGKLPVFSKSLSNPYLSTYWVEGREVEFEIVEQFMPYDNFNPVHRYASVIHDDYSEDSVWDRIERELSEKDITGSFAMLQWLKENYNPPTRKL